MPSDPRVEPLRSEIRDFFEALGLEARVIYRTCQEAFGVESPDNLKPGKPRRTRVTVFLDFANDDIRRDNLRAVYAFPEAVAEALPMLANPRLGSPKVELARMPPRFVFANLEELYESWRPRSPS